MLVKIKESNKYYDVQFKLWSGYDYGEDVMDELAAPNNLDREKEAGGSAWIYTAEEFEALKDWAEEQAEQENQTREDGKVWTVVIYQE